MSKIHILHENSEWVAPLRAILTADDLPHEDWHLAGGDVPLSDAPPTGVFYNRMSASSHTRGHRYAPELASGILAWLEGHGRRVVNGGRALELEISKTKQYAALNAVGIPTPRTVVTVGKDHLRRAIRDFGAPLILKPNRGGKGLGVQKFDDVDAALAFVDSDAFDAGPDGTVLVQQYVKGATPHIIRNEFVGGRFLYAVRVDTSDGFELCPADVCGIDAARGGAAQPKFEILDGFSHPLHEPMTHFLARNDIEVAGIEMITDADGQSWVYDVNTNTNYNPEAEAAAGLTGTDRSGMGALAAFLAAELHDLARLDAAAD
ncbi:MAG: alpha-L-glutamate ligase [Alphaproteobacteria bacterium]|nr:alpha-L-glutamate ligase [Alphaproteobacteria bacterium]